MPFHRSFTSASGLAVLVSLSAVNPRPAAAERPTAPPWALESAGASGGAPDVDPASQEEIAGVARQHRRSDRSGWVFLPGVTYTPDRGLTVAGGALRYFRADDPPARASRIVLTAEGSMSRRGMISFDPDVWFASERFHLGGTFWVSYLDYAYFGVGNDTRMADRENFTSVRWTARPEFVQRITHELYGGAVYELRYEDQVEVEEGGQLDRGEVVGKGGGVVSGLGLLLRWDSRDHSFTPHAGGLVTLSPRLYRGELGSDFDFARLLLEGSWFFGLGGDHVLALDGRVDLRSGRPPFSYLAGAGGSRLLRGMLEGRFRDMHFVGGQVEYRYPLWWRFGGATFGGLGRVAAELGELGASGLKYSVGSGLRFVVQEDERITVRVDYGRTADDSGFYLAMLEAF